jgi:hypothetical protein
MGQRAFRGRVTDSLIKNYFGNEIKEQKDDHITYYRTIDLEYTFNLDSPLDDVDVDNINLARGLINLSLPKNTKIGRLKLTILSKLFVMGKSYLNCNLYILFGSHFITDIGEIDIYLMNPDTNELVNDRKVIQNILDYMCFKTIKRVAINNDLLYNVIPEYSEFSVVLAYDDCVNLKDLFFHTYCMFEASIINFSKCLRAIDKTLTDSIKNIILPVIYFNKCDVDNYAIIPELSNFISDLSTRFKSVSCELRIKSTENYEDFISRFVEENLITFRSFEQIYIAFHFENITPPIEVYKHLIVKFNLENVTFAFHNSYTKMNIVTNLDDQYDYYEYIRYNKPYTDNLYKMLHKFKVVPKLSKSVYIKHLVLQKLHGENYRKLQFDEGVFNHSQILVKNKKLVPLELSKGNAFIYKN